MSSDSSDTASLSATSARVLPHPRVCEQARRSRDPRFDGLFFVGVVTTGIYCRTICPARIPAEANVRYFATQAAAQEAGFRACRRCWPDQSMQLPEWTLGSETVVRALRLIEAGFLNNHTSADLAARMHMGERQLARLFQQELGASPTMLGRYIRARVARNLLQESSYRNAEVAFHAGYNSLSRFNAEIRDIFQCTPTQLRKSNTAAPGEMVSLTLPVRQPYHFDWVFAYLQRRALPGLEEVHGDGVDQPWEYRRRLAGPTAQWLTVRAADSGLLVDVPMVDEPVHELLHRVRMVFDLNADGPTLHEFLLGVPRFAPLVQQAPGLRVPGAWDGFETSVRAILGQQVSVERGTTLAIKMMHSYGAGTFPSPQQLIGREVAELGMPGRRGRAVVQLAEQVVAGHMRVDECQDYAAMVEQLVSLDGIGPWTANYIRMRVLKDPDAFPDNDWVVLKELDCSAAYARRESQAWRPWRAYGLMYLWYAAGRKKQMAAAARRAN